MTRHVRLVVVLAFIVGAVSYTFVAGQAAIPPGEHPAGFADPVLGRWDLTVEGVEGAYPSWLLIHMRKDTQLQANFVGRFGSVRCATLTDFDNGQLTVVIPVQYEERKTDLKFVGKVAGGDKLEGATEDEKGRTIKWTGVRAPASTPIRTATWGAPIQLLNQNDMNGWRQRSTAKGTCWSVADGVLTNKTPCADLITEKTFTDFKLHVELMFPPKSNSGVYLRGRYEVQIQDDAGKPVDSHRMGGVYGFLTPYTNAVKPAGEWQAYDITLIGRRVSVVLNGTTIIDNEIIPGITGGAIDSRESEPGPLMLQGDHGKISFRNITLTPAQ
jgi:hypothetical protein